jgi:actin related protein 2/3 complex, subunit 3
MPVNHSEYNEAKGQEACGLVVLPLKTTVKGPAPPCAAGTSDCVDEALELFRANVLFRQFDPQGPGDRLLCYLTIWISELLREFARRKTKAEAKKEIVALAMSGNFKVPGDTGFCLAGFFPASQSRSEQDLLRSFLRQVREETCNRLLDKAYNEDGSPNKWWIQFSKRKFMNIART